MHIGMIGVNHKTAPLATREAFARACRVLLEEARSFHQDHPFVLLSTCNRTEIYFSSQDLAFTHTYFLHLIKKEVGEEATQALYSSFAHNCFHHLVRVTAGLDSALTGETEIQGQVKNAYEKASQKTKFSASLHYCFQKALKIGKEVRTQFCLSRGVPDLAEIILRKGKEFSSEKKAPQILLIGASAINQELIRRFKKRGTSQITLCNRTDSKATETAKKQDLHTLPWNKLSLWSTYDWVICATTAPGYILVKEEKSPIHSPTLLIDLSVPRNIDPSLRGSPKTSLFNIDELNRTVQLEKKGTAATVIEAEEYAARSVQKHTLLLHRKRAKSAELACAS